MSTMPSSYSTNSSLEELNLNSSKPLRIHFEPLYDSCLIVLAVLIIAINVLITMLFARKRSLRTKTNTLLVSLAISDLNLGFIGIPMSIACNAFAGDPSLAGLCIAAAVVYRFIAVSTIFHIFAITVERYILVIYPFKYINLVRMRRLKVAIGSIWVSSLFIALIQLSWQDFSDFNSQDPIKLKCGLIYNVFGILLCFVIPLAVMIFTYVRMFKVIRRQLSAMKRQNFASDGQCSKPLTSEMRAITIFALMLGIFTSCWFTWYLGLIREYISDVFYQLHETWFYVFDFLRFSVSFLNPLLYTFLKHDFRQALWSLLPRETRRENPNKTIYLSLDRLPSSAKNDS